VKAAITTPTYNDKQLDKGGAGLEGTVKWAAIGLLALAGIVAVSQLSPALKSLNFLGGRE
jgi:hypothetical protein